MKIVFMGTPEYAVPSLEALIKEHEVCAVVSQPDRPAGRGKQTLLTPVKAAALKANIPVLQPERVRKNPEFFESLKAFQADVFVVVAYGQILPTRILQLPTFGCINAHASLLPKYRGAAPIQWAILNGESLTGVTIIYMEQGMDTGDELLKKELPIEETDNSETMHDKLSNLSAIAFLEALALLKNGTAPRCKQADSATYAPMLTKDLGLIDWSKSTDSIFNLIRGLRPWPGAYTSTNLKIWSAEKLPLQNHSDILPGVIVDSIKDKGIVVKTGDGALLITELQALNRQRLSAPEFLRGARITIGEKI